MYASASLALAALETFVHLGEEAVHIRFSYVRILIALEVAWGLESKRDPR